jgi:hypothetical protein
MLRSERTYASLSDRFARRALQARKRRDERAGARYSRIARHYRRMAQRAALHGKSR